MILLFATLPNFISIDNIVQRLYARSNLTQNTYYTQLPLDCQQTATNSEGRDNYRVNMGTHNTTEQGATQIYYSVEMRPHQPPGKTPMEKTLY